MQAVLTVSPSWRPFLSHITPYIVIRTLQKIAAFLLPLLYEYEFVHDVNEYFVSFNNTKVRKENDKCKHFAVFLQQL